MADILGSTVDIVIDRPLGSRHPEHPDIVYGLNYGYVPGRIAPDGEEQDVYILGVDVPVERYTGVVIAILHRLEDIETKWIAAPIGYSATDEQILAAVAFQERFFTVRLER